MRVFLTPILALIVTYVSCREVGAIELPREDLTQGGDVLVVEVIDGETVLFADGREARLLGILAPRRPADAEAAAPAPMAARSRLFLAEMVEGRHISLYYDGEGSDRYGRLMVHMVRDDGLWVQGAMLEAGMARVMTQPVNRAAAGALYLAEESGRSKGGGVWSGPKYGVRCATNISSQEEGFQIVQGRIVDAADVRGVIYLNFGADYRSDFTARIERKHQRLFRNALDWDGAPVQLVGKRVEVRGWIFRENGAMVDLDHPEQLRVLIDDGDTSCPG